jgi:hypothetical protein
MAGTANLVSEPGVVSRGEWGDEEQFYEFFDSAPKMAEFLEGAGITNPPTVSVFDSQNLPGTF